MKGISNHLILYQLMLFFSIALKNSCIVVFSSHEKVLITISSLLFIYQADIHRILLYSGIKFNLSWYFSFNKR